MIKSHPSTFQSKLLWTVCPASGTLRLAAFLLALVLVYPSLCTAGLIHFVYMSPSDVAYNAESEAGIENAARTLQAWFPDELVGKTFALNADVVEWYQTPRTPRGIKLTLVVQLSMPVDSGSLPPQAHLLLPAVNSTTPMTSGCYTSMRCHSMDNILVTPLRLR